MRTAQQAKTLILAGETLGPTVRGVDFLENWIATNITVNSTPLDAETSASRCIEEVEALGIARENMEGKWGSVRHAILDAIAYVSDP
jgi:hypothetical protein